jgi:hypothetical protein
LRHSLQGGGKKEKARHPFLNTRLSDFTLLLTLPPFLS